MSTSMNSDFSQEHQKSIGTTYLALGFVFLLMLALSVFAYFTIVNMAEMNSKLSPAATAIKGDATRANMLYREIASGASSQDMNAVWELISAALGRAGTLGEFGEGADTPALIEKFKDTILVSYTSKEPDDAPRLKAEYDQAFNNLLGYLDGIERRVKDMVEGKMRTFRNLYIALLVNFIVLFFFTIFTFRRYIGQRRLAEVELTNMRENLSTILNSLDCSLVTIDTQGIIVQWNAAAEKYFNIPKERALGYTLWGVVPFLKEYQPKVDTVFHSHKPKILHHERVGGKFLDISMNYSQGIDGVVITVNDVTKDEIREEQVRQSQKMEVVENMVGGLAHDFNNVLGAITGTISMMRFSLENQGGGGQDDIMDNIDVIESSAERAVVMVQQLLSLSQKQDISLAPIDLNLSIRHILKICENTFDKRIEISAELYDVKSLVNADAAQLEQALLSLCDNAAQAMTTMRRDGEQLGGELSISVEKVYPDKNFRAATPEAEGGSYWIVKVADTGIGMSAETAAKIFDPFFTTKKDGGTGLGLTFVNDIVRKHRGFIKLESVTGKGTMFSIYLPELTGQAVEEDRVVTDESESIPVGSGLVFVVDDEEIMRKTSSGILRKLGYEVLFAENGEEAVNIFRERHADICITLLDMAMPKKSGKDAYAEMREIDPELKVILVSGFKRDERIDQVLQMGVNCFIKKPYSLSVLAQEIKRVLGNGGNGGDEDGGNGNDEDGGNGGDEDGGNGGNGGGNGGNGGDEDGGIPVAEAIPRAEPIESGQLTMEQSKKAVEDEMSSTAIIRIDHM